MWKDQPGRGDERLNDVDRALVHALQVDPRAPWARIAQVLRIDAATVARRWAALTESRTAWLTVACDLPVESRALGLVRIPGDDVESGPWRDDPRVLTADRTGEGTLLLVHDTDPHRLALAVTALVQRPHTLEPVIDASLEHDHALDVLSPRQIAELTVPALDPAERGRPVRPETVREVAGLLAEDVRMSLGSIAHRLDVSDATARRLLERLLGLGLVRLGCDVAAPALGQHREVVLRFATFDDALAAVVTADPAVSRVVRSVGPAAATVHVRLASLGDLPTVEANWGGAQVVDRWSVVAPLKRNGVLLDETGRPAIE